MYLSSVLPAPCPLPKSISPNEKEEENRLIIKNNPGKGISDLRWVYQLRTRPMAY
jgi:hypothetical protein